MKKGEIESSNYSKVTLKLKTIKIQLEEVLKRQIKEHLE